MTSTALDRGRHSWYNCKPEHEGGGTLAKRTYVNLMRRLAKAGYKREFVDLAILPDWWDDSCAGEPDLLPDVEFRVARFLDLPLLAVKDPRVQLNTSDHVQAKLRRVRDLDRDRLAPAIHAAIQIAGAVVRNLKTSLPYSEIPSDPIAWRHRMQGGPITLDKILEDLWSSGVPVVPLETIPAPNFQGLVCIVADRPVILLGHRHDELGRVAFLIAHEAGHIAAGDCSPNSPVVDEEEIDDNEEIEQRADRYATMTLVGSDIVPLPQGGTFRELAVEAVTFEKNTGTDASQIIFAWAAKSGDYVTAIKAVKALYRHSGARTRLRKYFQKHVDSETAPDSDQSLLRCVYGGGTVDGAH